MRISISNLRAAKKERHRRMAGLCQNEKVQELLKLSDLVIWLGTGYELQVTQLKPLNDDSSYLELTPPFCSFMAYFGNCRKELNWTMNAKGLCPVQGTANVRGFSSSLISTGKEECGSDSILQTFFQCKIMDLTGFGGPVWLHSDVTGKEKAQIPASLPASP
ncbi:hypothetical protein MG293_020192 [Ovis ammon polii]|uniref:Uncharacterized protein n=1 Tax=Ovis ammon polii TaxID=230172 RepID=A0AAD4TNA7_OVIAM|nr:hypothetical protein MG293_020192 [Ovis ammon polii]